MKKFIKIFSFLIILHLIACAPEEQTVLRLATTTSTDDSGLLNMILPDFEEQFKARVDVVAVGTGQAIALGEAGDVDAILVHARQREDAFMEDGHGIERFDVMYNDFVIVGPLDDPAGILGMQLASEAMAAIAISGATFASRGDDSGTHSKELSIWDAIGKAPDATSDWYKSLGQGMGATLLYAEEVGAYILTDRGTYLALKDNLANLDVMFGGENIADNLDAMMLNPYSLILVNPEKGNISSDLAQEFARWLGSIDTQQKIADYGSDDFGDPLFYANSEIWNNR